MIVIDTSAIVAIALGEDERETFLRTIAKAGKALVSTASVVEARLVVHGRRGQRGVSLLDDFLRSPFFEIVPPGQDEADAAYAGLRRLRKGQRAPGGAELRRLLQLRAREDARPAATLQGRRFRPH